MSGIIEMIDSNEQNRKETVATTVRMSEEISAQIEGLVDYLDTTKNEVMIRLLKTALNKAYTHLYNKDHENAKAENHKGVSYFLVNTNKGHNIDDHKRMVSQGQIEALGDLEKQALSQIQKNDIVFLYVNGEGIVASGKASGVIKTGHRYNDSKKEAYSYQALEGFKLLSKPLKTKDIYKKLGRSICCLYKISFLADGDKLLK